MRNKTQNELEKIATAVRQGAWIEPANKSEAMELDASLLSALIMGYSIPSGLSEPQLAALAGRPIRIRGATIEGDLDLRGAMSVSGGALPPLSIVDCDINGAIQLRDARIASISLARSRMRGICASDSVIDGVVDLKGIAPYQRAEGLCWVDFQGASIGGNLYLTGARLRSQPMRAKRSPGEFAHSAFSLQGGRTDGAIYAFDLHAEGGVNLQDATICGEAWFAGCRLTQGEGKAFNLQGGKIEGVLMFALGDSVVSSVIGDFWMLDASIGGTCDLDGGTYRGIVIAGATIGGRFTTLGATLGSGDDGFAVIGDHAILGDVEISSGESVSDVQGAVSLEDVRIRGNLRLDGAQIGLAQPAESAAERHSVSIRGAIVDGEFSMVGTQMRGWLNGRRSRVAGDVKLFGSKFAGGGARRVVSFDLATIGGDFQLGASPKETRGDGPGLEIDGPVEMDGVLVKGSVILERCSIRGGPDAGQHLSLSVMNATIGFDMVCTDLAIEGRISFAGATIGRRLCVRLQALCGRGQAPTAVTWIMHGAQARILADDEGLGWYPRCVQMPDCIDKSARVRLGSFTYDGIEKLTVEEFSKRKEWLVRNVEERPLPLEATWWVKLLADRGIAWPKVLTRRRRAYSQQPYLQLASVYHRMGRDDDADAVIRLKMKRDGRVAGSLIKRGMWWAFDAGFGSGFRPRNAFCTVLVAIALGACMTKLANDAGMLVLDANPVVGAIGSGDVEPGYAMDSTHQHAGAAIRCGESINAVLYAIDVFVPLIDLRQESECKPRHTDVNIPNGTWPMFGVIYSSTFWFWAKAMYAILGWVLTSLALLTFSGVLRRRAEKRA